MQQRITIAEHTDGQIAYMLGWDTRELDMQGLVLPIYKRIVSLSSVEELQSSTSDRINELLREIINTRY